MSDGGHRKKKRRWPIRWYHAFMDWRVWKDWPWWVKVIAVIWMLLPFPHLYEILKVWLPWIHPLLDEIGIRLPTLPQPELSQEEQDQSLFDQVRASILVIAAWYGVFFLIWRTVLVDRQTYSVETQTQINRENHYTDLFTKAVEQLGATRQDGEPAIEMRIGAIFALERLAKDSERDYGPIIETLAAYIREHCHDPESFDDEGLSGEELKQARQKWIDSLRKNPPADRSDVAAALTVLSRREKNRNWISTSDHETQPDFTGANFQGVTLDKVNLSGANLLRANLSGTTLQEADLSGANLEIAHLEGADLMKADLTGAKLMGANLSDASLFMARLWYTNLSNADLSGTSLFSTDLVGAKLQEADLSGANLVKADLSSSDLEGATFADATLTEANLEGALLVGSQLEDSKGLTDEMIEKAFGDADTSLPDGITRPEHWKSRKDAILKW